MLEYTFTNTSDNTLSFKKIDFKTDSPFESTLIVNLIFTINRKMIIRIIPYFLMKDIKLCSN